MYNNNTRLDQIILQIILILFDFHRSLPLCTSGMENNRVVLKMSFKFGLHDFCFKQFQIIHIDDIRSINSQQDVYKPVLYGGYIKKPRNQIYQAVMLRNQEIVWEFVVSVNGKEYKN